MKLFDWFKEQPVTEPAATGEAREPFPSPEFWLNDYIREVDNHSWFWRCPWCPTTGHRPGGRDPNAWSAERAYLDLTTHILGHMAECLRWCSWCAGPVSPAEDYARHMARHI